MGTGTTGFGNSTVGSVSNAVGAMNTPQAQEKAGAMTKAFDTGYRGEANKGLTEGAFGAVGLPGAAVGKAVGTLTNPAAGLTGDDEGAARAGAALAKQEGLGSVAKGAGSLAAGLFGGPVMSALASMALSGISYGMQRSAHPSAFGGQPAGSPAGPVSGPSAIGGPAGGAGGAGGVPSPMAVALSVPGQPTGFEAASNVDRSSYQNLGLENII